jgi:hypothetical protein
MACTCEPQGVAGDADHCWHTGHPARFSAAARLFCPRLRMLYSGLCCTS